jgi:hypothetical protein
MQIAILVLSILFVLFSLLYTRACVRRNGIIIPPLFSGTIVFSCFIAVVVAIHVSAMHLLWLFQLSYVFGTIILISPIVSKFMMSLLDIIKNI